MKCFFKKKKKYNIYDYIYLKPNEPPILIKNISNIDIEKTYLYFCTPLTSNILKKNQLLILKYCMEDGINREHNIRASEFTDMNINGPALIRYFNEHESITLSDFYLLNKKGD